MPLDLPGFPLGIPSSEFGLGGDAAVDEGVALDLEYVATRSFFGDVAIVLRTLWQIVRGRQF